MSGFPAILHHGARDGVTGSCHELRVSDTAGILVDCGLFQGDDELRRVRDAFHTSPRADSPAPGTDPLAIDFPIAHIKALVVTHVHIDHVGRIPYLLAAGFTGPILCSEPSAVLLPLVLEDAVKVGFTRERRLVEKFLDHLKERLVAVPYGRWHPVATGAGNPKLSVKLKPAGHILGSAYVECKISKPVSRRDAKGAEESFQPLDFIHPANSAPRASSASGREIRLVFSGDLGAPYTPLLPAPRSPYRADVLVLESTYGDRLHDDRRTRRAALRQVIERALADRGVILVPAFSIGRTQELLYELEEIIHRNRERFATRGLPWAELEIVVDSPLASRFTEAYRQLRPFWDAEARQKLGRGRHPLAFEQLTTIASHQDHLHTVAYLKKRHRPCLVIAASGMCAGGRIVNYLKALLGEPSTDVLFIGYQAQGTPGRAIQQYGPGGGYVVLDGERCDIRAQIHTLGGYSAHADQKDLVNFVRRMRHRPQEVRLVHGETEAKAALAKELEGLGIFVQS